MIDPKLLVVKPVGELERISNPLTGDLLYYDGSANLKRSSLDGFRSLISSGIKGEATPTTTPTPWASGQPDLYEKYDVKTAGTYTNFKDSSNAAIVISTADLTSNFVQIWVKNGVSVKVLSSKPVLDNEMTYDCRISIEGQSNAYGYGVTNDLINNPPYNALGINWLDEFNRVFIWNPNTNNYENLKLKVNNTGYLNPSEINWFGVEVSIALTWLKIHKYGNLYIDKHVENGQPISYFQKGSSFYTTRLIPRKAAANAWLQARNIKVYDQGFVWIQGESDLNQTQTYYFDALKKLISDRKDDGFIKNYTTIVLAQINTQNANYSTNIANAKLDYINFDKRSKLITYPNSTISDNIHLNANGQIDLGLQAAKAVFNSDSYVITDFSPSVKISTTFDPSNNTDAITAKPTYEYLAGTSQVITTKVNYAVGSTWNQVVLSGYLSTIIDVKEGDIIQINGLVSSNTDYVGGLKPTGVNRKDNVSRIYDGFQFVVPFGYEKFSFTSNGSQAWTVTKKTVGLLDTPKYTNAIKTVTWSDGTWSETGTAQALTGARKTPLYTAPSKIKLDNFNFTEQYLKLYYNNGQMLQLPIVNGKTYDLKGFQKYTIVIIGTESNQVVTEITAVQASGSGTTLNSVIDLIDYGCAGDGVTDDTAKINQAIIEIIARGGGTLYGRDKKFKVTTLSVPNAPDWVKVEIRGSAWPPFRFGTIGNFDILKPTNSMEILSSVSGTNSSVISVAAGSSNGYGFNLAVLHLRNLTIRTYNNPFNYAVNAHNAGQLIMENVGIDTGVYNVQASEPTNMSVGILTPTLDNAALTELKNVSVSGYRYGISVNEHTNGDQIIVSGCMNGLWFRKANHASYFARVCLQRNTNQVVVEDTHVFEIAQLNMEYAGSGQTDANNVWQSTAFELSDPGNKGIGNIRYANVKGGLGPVSTFRFNGGANVIVKKVGNDTRVTATIPSP